MKESTRLIPFLGYNPYNHGLFVSKNHTMEDPFNSIYGTMHANSHPPTIIIQFTSPYEIHFVVNALWVLIYTLVKVEQSILSFKLYMDITIYCDYFTRVLHFSPF